MSTPHLILAACLLAGAPAGWAASLASGRLAEAPGRSWRWTAAMAAGAIMLFGWAWAMTPPNLVLAASLALAWTLLVLAVVDVSAFRLPDILTLPLCTAGLLLAWRLPASDGLVDHIVGSVAGYGVLATIAWAFRRLRGVEGIGMGDAKLLAAAGAWLGWRALPSVLVLGCLGGLLWWSVARMTDRRPERDPRIPFGAPLCAAIWVIWLYGPLQLGSQ